MCFFKKSIKSNLFIIIVHICYALLMMAYAGFSLSSSIISYTETLKFSLNFAGFQNNWSSDVVNYVSVVQSPKNCTYGTEDFFQYTWPGTEVGCNCINSEFIEKNVFKSECKKTQLAAKCKNIAAWPSLNFTNWKDHYKICVSRVTAYNFAAYHIKGDLKCSNGNIACGQSINYIFCIPNGTLCPITSMIISEDNPNPALYLEKENFFGNYYLWYSRTVDETPIVEAKISQNYPCFDYSLTNIDKNDSDYILMNNKRQNCQEDKRWMELNSIIEKDFYDANINTLNLTETFPNYTISEYVNARLWTQYYRNVIHMNFDFLCRTAIDKLMTSDEVYSTEIDTQTTNLIISVFVFFIFVLVYPYFQIVLFLKRDFYFIKIDEVMLEVRSEQKTSLARTTKLFQFPFLVVALVISFTDLQIFEDISKNQCSDKISNLQFKEAAINIREKSYNYNLDNIIFLIVLIVFDGLLMIFQSIFRKESEKNFDISSEEYINIINKNTDMKLKKTSKHIDDYDSNRDEKKKPEDEFNFKEEEEEKEKEDIKGKEYEMVPVMIESPVKIELEKISNEFDDLDIGESPDGHKINFKEF